MPADPSWLARPETRFLSVAALVFGLAWATIRWVGRSMRQQLGLRTDASLNPSFPARMEGVSPALVKAALERGLVTPEQLVEMTPTERQLVFASLRSILVEEERPG